MIRVGKFYTFVFRITAEMDKCDPIFPVEEVRRLSESDDSMSLTIIGSESASLLAIHNVVDYFDYHLWPNELIGWEFIPSARARSEEMTAYLNMNG